MARSRFQVGLHSVVVSDGQDTYVDTPENFELDFEQAVPEMPPGATHRYYEPGYRHGLMDDDQNVTGGGELSWAIGDEIIGKLGDGLAKQAARIAEVAAKKKAEHEAQDKAAQEELQKLQEEANARAAQAEKDFYARLDQRVKAIVQDMAAPIARNTAAQGQSLQDLINIVKTQSARIATLETQLASLTGATPK